MLVVALLGGCGGDDDPDALVVSAAASLTDALRSCAPDGARLQFGGSDELAAQLRQGVEPDVFAAANTTLPQALAAEGLLERPRVFATNELVLAVPASGAGVGRLADLGRPGVTVVVGAPSVPVGSYTRKVLGRLEPGLQRRVLANVRSEEPDVKGVVGKLVQGAADAGFVYRTDVRATTGRLRAVALPRELQPVVRYGAAVVRGSGAPGPASAFVDDLVRGACAGALREAGFGAP
ncbi:MAG TPA: molybdate ABC transporter substrate-binding protein [Baekduia sp.]|nr:molybdate ABC transporter substrate-binding protein [Baekduia sp.]